MSGFSLKVPKADWVSSLVVLIIAVPLSLGIALASGVPAKAALITAVVGGILVGALSGAPLVVSGPAAGLSLLVFEIVQKFGFQSLLWITFLAGMIQVGMGLLRMGGIFNLVPNGILQGMLAAIGLTILLGQLHVLFGSAVPSSPIQGILALPETIWSGLSSMTGLQIFLCGAFAITAQLLWPKLVPQKWKWIPGALPAVFLATLISLLFSEIPRVQVESFFGGPDPVTWLGITPDWQVSIISTAIGLALIASAESLLTARAIDGLAQKKGLGSLRVNLNRELLAQGTGNMVSGGLGGIPMTGVIVRSAANIDSGATSRASTILHGIWILLFVGLMAGVLRAVPLTALASVLILTGFKLLNIPELKKLWSTERPQAVFWVMTMAAICSQGLLVGLGFAIALYAVYALVISIINKTERESATSPALEISEVMSPTPSENINYYASTTSGRNRNPQADANL